MSGVARRGLRGTLRGLAKSVRPDPKPLTVADRLDRWARRIGEFGILDREYLEAQVGRTFATDDEAISFYVHNDGRRGLSLSPLIEPEWMREHQPSAQMSWYDALHQEDAALFQTGPIFDAAVYAASAAGPDRPASTLDALRRFLRSATADSTLPVPPERPGPPVRWGDEREAALARARAFAAAQHRTRKRYRSTWDGPEESALEARYANGIRQRDAEQPLVSIVMPVFERADVVGAAIASVVGQRWTRWELIVVDDGSTDETASVVAALASDDPRIKLLRQENGGAGAARNTGLRAATGTVVAFLDADNTWRSAHLSFTLAALYDSGASAVHDGLRMVGGNNADDTSGPVETYRGEDGSFEDLLAGNFIDLNAVVARRSAVDSAGEFDGSLRRWIDWEWLLRLAKASGVPEYVPYLGVDYDNVLDQRRVSSSQPASWQEVAVAPHLIDWEALATDAGTRDRSLVSVVMPVYRDWTMTRRAIEAVLADADATGQDVETIVVDNGSPRSVFAILDQWFAHEPRVRIDREDRNRNFALGSDLGLARSRGRIVVMLNNDTEVQPGWLAPLVSALDDPSVLGAQPLLTYPDGTVQAAGTVFGGEKVLPWHFLAEHPRYDAARAFDSGPRRFTAITAAAAAFRATDLIAWRGFDPLYANGLEDVDLCLRAVSSAAESGQAGSFVVVPTSVVVHHESRTPGRNDARIENRRVFDERWAGSYPAADAGPHYAAAGLRYLGVAPGEPKGHRVEVRSSQPIVVTPSRLASPEADPADPPQSGARRWAIKDDGSAPEAVASLVDAISAAGHDVAVDERSSWYRSSSGLDDVVVAIGAENAFVAQPGAVNVRWGSPSNLPEDIRTVLNQAGR